MLFDFWLIGLITIVAILLILVFAAFLFRRVVPTNEVHIIQTRKKTKSYGKDLGNGNTYYQWPTWAPFFGVQRTTLPVSVFDLDLDGYEAYDKGRLPFIIDVKAFFRINNSDVAAQRVSSFSELESQLKAIVQGAVRTILASNEIEEIMQGRSKFGQEFTNEVSGQLTNWGVETVKNIELMDIRDAKDSHVIRNIMEKKKSHIEMESRQEVAQNMKVAQSAEIDANREVELQRQVAEQAVGLRKVETNKAVAIATQEAQQLVNDQLKMTREKEMLVERVTQVKKAEIEKDVKVVAAQQDKETKVIIADGQLEAKRKESMGIEAEGEAKANAERAMLLAPVEAQVTLAKEIGANESYQKYLVTIRQIEAGQFVGGEQAKALEKANIKIIANSGTPTDGLTSAMDLFSSSGGMKVGSMLEGLAQTDVGRTVLNKIVGPEDGKKPRLQ